MFLSKDNITFNHDSKMGNAIPTRAELIDPEIHIYLNFYNYGIPFIAIFIVLVNFIVVLSSGLLIKKGVEPRFTYLFLGNVALTDMVTGISILIGQYYPEKNRSHNVCAIQLGLIVSSALSSIYSVGLLAVDRYLYIVYGIKYLKWSKTRMVRIIIGLTWIMALVIGFLPLMGWSEDTWNGRVCWFIVLAPSGLIITTVIVGIVPIILVLILYSIILYYALSNITKIQCSVHIINSISAKMESRENLRMFRGSTELPLKTAQNRRKASTSYAPQKCRAIKIVLFTTSAFIFTWSPYFFACVVYVIRDCDYDPTSREVPDDCRTLSLLIASPLTILGLMNSLINPLIYAWWNNGFRSYVRKKIQNIFNN